ncbi:conserved domain protein [Mycoplasma mycoides subsp. mycoides SC str. Gladysdale]|nr:conserved domain protein [Mycoplasma mycoides subsp. mycoides SC str. Gladysdale]
MIYMFCGLIALTVILLIFTVKEDKSEKEENTSFNIKDVFGILKNVKIWLVSLVVMGVYMYQMVKYFSILFRSITTSCCSCYVCKWIIKNLFI